MTINQHKIISNSPDLVIGTSGHDSNQFKLALKFENVLIKEMNDTPDITVHFDNLGWKYSFYFPSIKYGLEVVFSEQIIDTSFTDAGIMNILLGKITSQLDKDWPLTLIEPSLPLFRVKKLK